MFFKRNVPDRSLESFHDGGLGSTNSFPSLMEISNVRIDKVSECPLAPLRQCVQGEALIDIKLGFNGPFFGIFASPKPTRCIASFTTNLNPPVSGGEFHDGGHACVLLDFLCAMFAVRA
jgi:hypothetical protein